MSYERNSFSKTKEQFDNAYAWLSHFHKDLRPTRIGHYKRKLEKLVAVHNSSDYDYIVQNEDEFFNALFEACEIIEIHRGLDGQTMPGLSARVNNLIFGNVHRKDEMPNKAAIKGRNTAFELIVASKFSSAGLILNLDTISDIETSIGNRFITIECKRPSSIKNSLSNLEEAIEQCNKRIDKCSMPWASGIIALDFSRMANPEAVHPSFTDIHHMRSTLEDMADNFLDEYIPKLKLDRERKIISVLVRFSELVIDYKVGLPIHAQQWAWASNPYTASRRKFLAVYLANSFQQITNAVRR